MRKLTRNTLGNWGIGRVDEKQWRGTLEQRRRRWRHGRGRAGLAPEGAWGDAWNGQLRLFTSEVRPTHSG